MVLFQEICCICLQKSDDLGNIDDKDDQDIAYIHKLSSFVPSQKWFPDFKICHNCINNLNEAYLFVQRCIKTQEQREQFYKEQVKGGHKPESIEIKEEKSTAHTFSCDSCGKSFKHKSTLRNHISKNHSNTDFETEDNFNTGFDSDVSNDKEFDIPLSDLINDDRVNKPKTEIDQEEIKEEEVPKSKPVNRIKENKEKLTTVRNKRGRKKKIEVIKAEFPAAKKKKPKLPVTCEYCERVFHHRQTFELHVRTNHTFEKPYECDLCPAKFVRNQNLMIHRRRHTNERPYICDTCGKDFASSGNLSHHSKIHLNKREYQCDMCDKSFNKSGNLSAHKTVVHSDPTTWKFICQVCGKKFPVKGGLVLHMQRHDGKKEDVCHICKKEFLNKYELKRHMQSHCSDLTFDCSVCKEKTFKTKYGLRRHLAFTHNIGKVKYWKAEKKYACHMCPKMFTNNYKLRKHLNTHSNENKPMVNPTIYPRNTAYSN